MAIAEWRVTCEGPETRGKKGEMTDKELVPSIPDHKAVEGTRGFLAAYDELHHHLLLLIPYSYYIGPMLGRRRHPT